MWKKWPASGCVENYWETQPDITVVTPKSCGIKQEVLPKGLPFSDISGKPDLSIIVISHNKPLYVRDAIQCVLDQTYPNWQGILVDSGILLNQGFFDDVKDPRLSIIPSGETPEFAKTRNMASWCINEILNSGRISGELVLYLCDDDLLYPKAFETFWHFYAQHDRQPQAMYSSQDIGLVGLDGKTTTIGRRLADRPAGRFCKGKKMDCRVDYLQFCHTAKILEEFRRVYKTDQYQSEDKRDASHADGIFMEQIGALTKVYNIPDVLSMNRRTVQSVNLEYSTSPRGRALITLRQKLRGGWDRVVRGRRY